MIEADTKRERESESEVEKDFDAIGMVLLRNRTVGFTNSVSHNTADNTRVGKAHSKIGNNNSYSKF